MMSALASLEVLDNLTRQEKIYKKSSGLEKKKQILFICI